MIRAAIRISVENTAETRWLSAEGEGWTRLGAHLYRAGDSEEVIDYDWLRVALPDDVEQYERVDLAFDLPPIDTPGRYRVEFDIVIEGMMWLGDRGSQTSSLTLDIEDLQSVNDD